MMFKHKINLSKSTKWSTNVNLFFETQQSEKIKKKRLAQIYK